MTKNIFIVFLFAFLSFEQIFSMPWPAQPTSSADPGSVVYINKLFHETQNINGRTVEFYAPENFQNSKKKLTVIIFGHGQTIPVESYRLTFEHLAKKGMIVIFPQFDNGFFDQDWQRMGADYIRLSFEALKKYSDVYDTNHIIFSGHSKGAYVSLVASGLHEKQQLLKPASIILFEPAGYDAQLIKNINPKIPVTVTWSAQDTIIKEPAVREIYNLLPSEKKQYIQVQNDSGLNPQLQADHFFVLTAKFTFGGNNGITPLHYFGTWKWLLGAAWDLESNSNATNQYIYGDLAQTSGSAKNHIILRNWSL